MSPAAAQPRLLLLVPTTTYRTEDFVEAARRLDVDLVVAAERPNTLAAALPDNLLTLPFDDPAAAAALMRDYARARPVAAVVPVDGATTLGGPPPPPSDSPPPPPPPPPPARAPPFRALPTPRPLAPRGGVSRADTRTE